MSIVQNPVFGDDTCTRCQAALEIGKFLAMAAPEQGPVLAVQLCEQFKFSSDCAGTVGELTLGSTIVQVIVNANVGGYDGQVCTDNS